MINIQVGKTYSNQNNAQVKIIKEKQGFLSTKVFVGDNNFNYDPQGLCFGFENQGYNLVKELD